MHYASLQPDSSRSTQYAASRGSLFWCLLSAFYYLVPVLGLFFLVLCPASRTQAAETAYTYDAAGRLTSVINAEGQNAVYDYDALGNILAVRSVGIGALNIAGFSPGQGSIGSTVNIVGSGFDLAAANNTVTFNGIETRATAASASSLTVIVPPGATTGKITVQNARDVASTGTDYRVVGSLVPSISAITPDVGMPGSMVSISGSNFLPGTADNRVTLSQRTASVKSAQPALLTVTVPTQAGSGKFQVTNAYGTAISSADFFIPPSPYGAQQIEVKKRMGLGETVAIPKISEGKLAMILFDATAGQRVSISLSAITISYGKILLVKPDGTTMKSDPFWMDSTIVDFPALPTTGTYAIVVVPSYAGAITMQLNGFDDLVEVITPGGPAVTVMTTVPGQNASLTFRGVAGQRIGMRVSGVTVPSAIAMTLLRPDGAAMASSSYISSSGEYFDAMELTLTGTYTIKLDPRGMGVGSMAVQLYDVPADVKAEIQPGGPAVTVTTTVIGQNASLTFSGVAGQRIGMRVSGVTVPSAIAMRLLRPDGTTMASSSYISSYGEYFDAMELTLTGTYTIKLDSREMGVGSMTVELYDVPVDVRAEIQPGGPAVTVATTVIGQNASLTFSGVAGQRIGMRVSGVTVPSAIAMTLLRPDGTTMASSSYISSYGEYFDAMELTLTGTYTIKLDPRGMGVGSMAVELYDVPVDVRAEIQPGGPAVTVATTVIGQNASLTFSGVAGQRISMRVFGISSPNAIAMTLLRPDGTTVASSNYISSYGAFFDVMELRLTGTYTVKLDPREMAVGNMTVQLYVLPEEVITALVPGEPAATILTTVPGQNLSLSFDGNAGQMVTIYYTDNGFGCFAIRLRNPAGGSIRSQYACGSSGKLDAQLLPTTGTYSLSIDPAEMAVGAIKVGLSIP
ncbi:IPT/TIG domain-containing protein [Noviherbaspirillum soli]|uniref:IPT/TIG domain-containing protein n=1 Tax=Noviherbaspirillum soli TaxID=1064518 RepID=UPI001889EABA|nr:IPT/TIG domain-containing protein [Noviherbaspirillum soli]